MPTIRTRDGTDLYVKDWGDATARPVILIHGYPLNADSFDRTAMKLAEAGFRAVSYDRRGFGRSGQPWQGYDWDTYADDLADVMRATGADDGVTVIGYSMGGGEAARYMSRHGGKGVVAIGLYASVVPGMLRADDNPAGHTPADYEGIVAGIEKDAAAFYRHTFLPPFYGKGGAHAASDDVIEAAVGAALMGSLRAMTAMPHNFTFGDFKDDIPAITVPTLILHGTEDKPAPIDATARRAHRMIPGSCLIEYEGHPHGFYATNSDQMIADTLAFVRQ
jgi:non-heme chloroperoxidase